MSSSTPEAEALPSDQLFQALGQTPPRPTADADTTPYAEKHSSGSVIILTASAHTQVPQYGRGKQHRAPPPATSGLNAGRRTFSGMPHPEVSVHFNKLACGLMLFVVAANVFYFYVRTAKTIPTNFAAYSWVMLAFEFLGSSTQLFYCLYLVRRKEYHYTANEDGSQPLSRKFHVSVLIPCYREGLEIVRATAAAAMQAALPLGCSRTVYILDDGRDPAKAAWVEELASPKDLQYRTGRMRVAGEVNGKSENLNFTLDWLFPDRANIRMEEVVCVMDADQVMAPNFFIATLQWMQNDENTIILTPQHFGNYDPKADIFNHKSAAYWDVVLPGQDGWGTVCCTGSNFLLRAQHAATVGWFPTWTMGEDVALALELQVKGYKSAYLPVVLATGEAPESVRACFMQKSRWCKGNMQLCFSSHNPALRWELPLLQKLIWCYGFYAYFVTFLCTPFYILVPIIAVLFNIFPIINSNWFALAFTLQMAACQLVTYWSPTGSLELVRGLWAASLANLNLWFTFLKATTHVIMGQIRNKPLAFKATAKSTEVGGTAAAKKKVPSAAGDLWMPAVVLVACVATAGIGVSRIITQGLVKTTWSYSLVVSILWCAYNAIPPYLLLHCAAFGKQALYPACEAARVLSLMLSVTVVVFMWLLVPRLYTPYTTPLTQSYQFYEAQRSGALGASNRVPWRGDSMLGDAYNGSSLVGGYYDMQGAAVKHTYPMAFATAMLAWGLLEFPKGHATAGQTQAALDAVKWGADYLIKCHTQPKQFVVQVGSPQYDSVWDRPEDVSSEPRPVFVVNASHPGSDIAASAAAALAATSIAFRSADPAYSAIALSQAESLYRFAATSLGLYSQWVVNGSGVSQTLYPSTTYLDDLAFATAWLHRATGDAAYLTQSQLYYARYQQVETYTLYIFDWANLGPATALLLAEAGRYHASACLTDLEAFLHSWTQGQGGPFYTPDRLAWTDTPAPLAVNANAAFLALLYGRKSDGFHLSCWAESQLRYMLSKFTVGFGDDFPQLPAHRGASCPTQLSAPCTLLNSLYSALPNPNILYGALVAGPNRSDVFDDSRMSAGNQVSLTYNAGFTGLLAGLAEEAEDHWNQCTSRLRYFWNPASDNSGNPF